MLQHNDFFVFLQPQKGTRSLRSRSGGMVDTRDLKSLAHCERVGSSPTFGTKHKRK